MYPTYTPTKIIKTLEKYGALRAPPPNPLNRLQKCLTLNAAIVPDNTSVNANPTLNPSTKIAPRVTRFSCKHNNKTVIEAGQGINPPVKPNMTICPVLATQRRHNVR